MKNAIFIRTSDFIRLRSVVVSKYSLSETDGGSVEIPEHLGSNRTGDLLYFLDKLWLISGWSPSDEDLLTAKLADVTYLFDRDIIFTGSKPSIEAFIADCITSEFINQADTAYKIPYLTVSTTSNTPYVAPALDDGNIFNLAEYILAARQSGVWLDFTVGRDTLGVSIGARPSATHNVFFDTGNNQLESVTIGNTAFAKLTIRKENGASYTNYTYYLAADGTISTSVPAQRAVGKWGVETCGADETPLDVATEIFRKNTQSHKIVFHSLDKFGLYDKVRLKLPIGVYDTQISDIEISSDDDRATYICGKLPTTLTERLKAAEKER